MQPRNSYDYANTASATDLSTIESLLLVDNMKVSDAELKKSKLEADI